MQWPCDDFNKDIRTGRGDTCTARGSYPDSHSNPIAFVTDPDTPLALPPANATTTPLLLPTPFHRAMSAANHHGADVQVTEAAEPLERSVGEGRDAVAVQAPAPRVRSRTPSRIRNAHVSKMCRGAQQPIVLEVTSTQSD